MKEEMINMVMQGNINLLIKLKWVILKIFILIIVLGACTSKPTKLPILGSFELISGKTSGEVITDTVYHTIQAFSFINQDSVIVTNDTFSGRVYVADFFFTSCPTICPVMKKQMLRVYDFFVENEDVLFLSHTIDPAYDSVAVLREYARRLGADSERWHFVTGSKEDIYKIAQVSYMSVAAEDEEAEGGFIHSGRFILVDKERRIRGAYDGTDPADVDKLMADITTLLSEYAE